MADDVLIIGGGIIGLSLAYELSLHDLRVRLIDRGQPGQEASWAGAGILPPATRRQGDHPYLQLAGLSCELLPQWSDQLRDETGIDNGFRRTGGIYVARDETLAAELEMAADAWESAGVVVERLSPEALVDCEPAIAEAATSIQVAYFMPGEAQLRNPRHLKALLSGCQRRGVRIDAGIAAEGFDVSGERIEGVRTAAGRLSADKICITGGAWSQSLLHELGAPVPLKPIRGQIVLLAGGEPLVYRIVNEGSRYLVPRPDGRVLIGSTEEDVGFDKQTTSVGVEGLLRFALELVPCLGQLAVERCWAGLRPGTPDRMPYLGRIADLENAFVAAGHFRSGLSLSAATAVVMSQLIRGLTPEIDLRPLGLDRESVASKAQQAG